MRVVQKALTFDDVLLVPAVPQSNQLEAGLQAGRPGHQVDRGTIGEVLEPGREREEIMDIHYSMAPQGSPSRTSNSTSKLVPRS